MKRVLCILVTTAILTLIGCSASVGDSCSDEGSTSACVDGAVCGKNVEGNLECMTLCEKQTDCGANQTCTGVSKTNQKGCRPNTVN